MKAGRLSEEEAFASFQTDLTEAMDSFIRTEIQLPESEMALTKTCMKADCKGELQGPSEARIAELRGVHKQHGSDPKVLTCRTCKTQFGCNEGIFFVFCG